MKSKRKIKAKSFENCVASNIVENYKINNSRPFTIPANKGSEQLKFSFFHKTIIEWNGLANRTVTAGSLDTFKSRLLSDSQ